MSSLPYVLPLFVDVSLIFHFLLLNIKESIVLISVHQR